MVQGLTGWFQQWRGRGCLQDFERNCVGQFIIFFICFLSRIVGDVLSECSHHGHIPSVDTGLHGNKSTIHVSMPVLRWCRKSALTVAGYSQHPHRLGSHSQSVCQPPKTGLGLRKGPIQRPRSPNQRGCIRDNDRPNGPRDRKPCCLRLRGVSS